MPEAKNIPAVPANEIIFLDAAMTNEKFRNALLHKERKTISDELDSLNITFSSDTEKQEALDAIEKIDWSDLGDLELLGRGGARFMG
jgi:hypothetical protein